MMTTFRMVVFGRNSAYHPFGALPEGELRGWNERVRLIHRRCPVPFLTVLRSHGAHCSISSTTLNEIAKRALLAMAHPLRVLSIGETGSEAVAAELRQAGFEPFFRRVGTEEQLQASLAENWDIAISDFTVGD